MHACNRLLNSTDVDNEELNRVIKNECILLIFFSFFCFMAVQIDLYSCGLIFSLHIAKLGESVYSG